MEVYVEKGKVIKKVGSELDTLKVICDWLEKYSDEYMYTGKLVDYSEEPVMSVKAKIAGSEVGGNMLADRRYYEDWINNRRWDNDILDRTILYGDYSPNGVIDEYMDRLREMRVCGKIVFCGGRRPRYIPLQPPYRYRFPQ